jgi:peptidoglycan hydrolase CwlO-like protein
MLVCGEDVNMTEGIILIISNALTAIASFFVGKRRSNAETDNTVLRNLELSVNLYRGIIEDLKSEIESLNIKIQELEKKVDLLHEENKTLRSKTKVK